ncbi:MAG: NUDIX domain-containing protein [Acidobacteriaceae bacterium]
MLSCQKSTLTRQYTLKTTRHHSRPPRHSAGLLLYRRNHGSRPQVLLAHPGGPFWTHRDLGAWTIPKGNVIAGEDVLEAARREFREETGLTPPPSTPGRYLSLGDVQQLSGKIVTAWAFEGEFDPAELVSNTSPIEWPPRSGREVEVPEIDRAEWFSLDDARQKILAAQIPFLDRLLGLLAEP